jgi:hypothetical protein
MQRTFSREAVADELRRNYAAVLDLARAGGFRDPETGWSADLVVAHLAANDELFLAVGEAVRRGERPDYENLPGVTDAVLERRVAEAGGAAGLVRRLEASSAALVAHVASMTDAEAATPVRFHVFHAGRELVDEVRPWGAIVAGQAGFHLPLHLAQLRALAGPAAEPR